MEYFCILVVILTRIKECLNISHPIWQSYINAILDCLQSRKYCEAIMDDLLLFTRSKETHKNRLEDLLKALLKNGLKVSPKKCQLFKTSLQYMENEIHRKQESMHKTAKDQTRSNLEATITKNTQRMQKFCRCSKFSQYVLPRFTKATKTHI